MSVFLIVGAVFMSAAAIQARRGHVAIEAIVGLLSPRVNRVRQIAGRCREPRVLRLLCLEILDPAGRGHRRQFPFRLDLGPAALDSLFADDRRHDAAQRAIAAADRERAAARQVAGMSVLSIGLLYGAATLLVMFAGMPIAFALGAVATVFMIVFMPSASVDTITQNVYEEMASITLLSIPLFILKGSAIGRSRAGQDLYGALHAWMHRIPGRARHRQRLRLRAVRRDGGLIARYLLGDRLRRHSGNAQARLFRRLRGRHHRRRRHARHPAAALDHHDPLRGRGRAVARPAVPRRDRAGASCWSRCLRAMRRGNSAANSARPRRCTSAPASSPSCCARTR